MITNLKVNQTNYYFEHYQFYIPSHSLKNLRIIMSDFLDFLPKVFQ